MEPASDYTFVTSNCDDRSMVIKWQSRALMILLGLIPGTCLILVAMPVSFLQLVLKEHHLLDSGMIGLLFSTYPIATFITSPLVGRISTSTKRRRVFILIGLPGLAISSLLFGCFPTNAVFLFLFRFLQGTFASIVMNAAYGLASDYFPTQRIEAVSVVEVFVGLGFVSGTGLGGILYDTGGFLLPFIFMMCLFLVLFAIYLTVVPSLVARVVRPEIEELLHDDHLDESKPEAEAKNSEKLTLHQLATVQFCVFTPVPFFAQIVASGFPSVLPDFIEMHMRISPGTAGLFYSSASLMYAFSSWFVPSLVRRSSHASVFFVGIIMSGLGLGIHAIASLMSGTIHSYRCYVLFTIGRCLCGFGLGLWMVPSLPALLHSVKPEFNGHPHTSGLVSGLWNSSFSLGQVLGPVFSTLVVSRSSFFWFAIIDGILCFALAAVLQVFTIAQKVSNANATTLGPAA